MKKLLNGGDVSGICEKIHFEGNLCYPTFHKMIWIKKEEPLRD